MLLHAIWSSLQIQRLFVHVWALRYKPSDEVLASSNDMLALLDEIGTGS